MIEARVSAIITAYNSEAFIAEAIRSVLQQSRAADEIIVVDDGSTDHTRQIVAEFADQGIKFIQQHNKGAGGARNRGIRETSGDFIAFLDADDIWLKDKTLLQLEYLDSHPRAALVSGLAHWWNVDKNTKRISGKVPKSMANLRREILVHNVLGNPSMVMVRRSALADVGLFNEAVRWGQDWDLWMCLVEKYEAGVVPEPVTVYRWHRDNLSHIRRWERLLSYWHVSLNGIRKSRPVWRRPLLWARSWSNFTYRRAMYAIQYAFPRWRHIWYAAAALLVYPFEMTREKLGALARALFGDRMYKAGIRVGLKPTYDRISRDGVIPLSPSLDHVGYFTPDVKMAIHTAPVLYKDWKEPTLPLKKPRLGIPTGPYLKSTSEEGLAHFEKVSKLLQDSGYELQPIQVMSDFAEICSRHHVILAAEAAQVHAEWFETYENRYSAKFAELVHRGQQVSHDQLQSVLAGRDEFRAEMRRSFLDHNIDLWICPSTVGTAPKGLESTGDPVLNLPWTQAGLPSLNLPVGKSRDHLPLGLQLVGNWYKDESLLFWAKDLEKTLLSL